MLKGKDIIDKSVVSYDTGERFAKVKDLLFDQNNNQFLGILVGEKGFLKGARIILLKDIQAFGSNAVIVPSKDSVIQSKEISLIEQILERNNILKGTRILTTDGRDLGTMVDMYFDESTGSVEGYEVSGGLFADAYSGRSFVPAIQTLKIGEEVAFVPSHTADYMEEQVGGIKAALQSASEKAQNAAQTTGDKLQELGQATSQKLQSAAEATGEKLDVLKVSATENAQIAADATSNQLSVWKRNASASITDAVVDPSEQKTFALGKTAHASVNAPNGQPLLFKGQLITPMILANAEAIGMLDAVYRAAGGSVAEKMGDRLSSAIANIGIEQALGRRVQQVVRTNNGIIIAAPGQIVTNAVIDRAKTYHKEQAILNAVGLSSSDAVRDRTQQLAGITGSRLKATTESTGQQFQSEARNLWLQAKQAVNELQERSAQAIEDKRIRGALGRPVTRVILDKSDGVILDVGELITHQAIDSARQADVLDVLLNSVYTDTPKLSTQNLSAHRVGQASL
jgi:uncharacterized protein YrrD